MKNLKLEQTPEAKPSVFHIKKKSLNYNFVKFSQRKTAKRKDNSKKIATFDIGMFLNPPDNS